MTMLPALRLALITAALLVLAPATAVAHPGHHHPGMPGAKAIVDIPFPIQGPSAGGYASENVEFVKNFPQHTDSAGGRRLADYFYITTERDLTIYDITDPPNPVEVGNVLLPEPGQPVFTEEDPDTNGRILLVSNGGILMVLDVSDKTDPKLLSTLDGADEHTITCVLDCTWAYGSEGAIIDLRDPAKPRLSEKRWQTNDIESEHDVTEVSPGIIVTSTQPIKLLDARTNPEAPTVVASGPKEVDRFVHANLWPRGGKDDFLLVGGEAVGPDCSASISATFSSWDARAWRETGAIKQLDEFRLAPGLPVEGRAPESSFCVHWFTTHPYYKNGGLVAIGWYEHGTHFLKIDQAGKISEVGFFLGGGGQASAAYWIDERTVYVSDYLRGLDVLRFNGDIGSPPAPDEEEPAPTGTQGEQKPAAPAADPAPSTLQARPGDPRVGCAEADGFRSTRVGTRGSRLAFGYSGATQAPVSIDVFQQSAGRRITGERLVARLTGRGGTAGWDGKANRKGRTVTDGYYFVRYRTRTASGTDTQRVALRRSGGRWSTRPSFYRRASCDLLRSFKLERPVFGGSTNRPLGITYQVERQTRVTVSVLRGGKVVRRFGSRAAEPGRTHRLRLGADDLPRGDYRVRVEATSGTERVTATAVSRRL